MSLHLLGLNLDIHDSALNQSLARVKAWRIERAAHIAYELQRMGLPCLLADAQKLADSGLIARPHFARAMVAKGLVSTEKKAFRRYLRRISGLNSGWPDAIEVLAQIQSAGGVAVLAHPLRYGMSRTKLRRCIEELKEAGLSGLEVCCGTQSPSEVVELSHLAEEFELYGSIGSDFHSPGKPWADLGKITALPSRCEPVWTLWN